MGLLGRTATASAGKPAAAMLLLLLLLNYQLLYSVPTPSVSSHTVSSSTQRRPLGTAGGKANNPDPAGATAAPTPDPLACKAAVDSEESASWALVLLLNILMLCIFMVYLLLISSFRSIPESVAVIALSAAAGLIIRLSGKTLGEVVSFDPNTFFLYLLPPIIFESGYSLHKGNFFSNLGSILIFAVFGTLISTVIVALGIWVLGLISFSYPLDLLDALIFGALISAVDPVATLAIFHALEVDPTLHMLVFGESVLNDAVAVVLYRTLLTFTKAPFTWASAGAACSDFLLISAGSIVIGVMVALIAALVFKYSSLDQYPSLEFSLILIFCYLPYLVAEGLELSGIMSILFNGIVMAHYAHYNLSAVTQLATQQTFRMLAFLAETCVFAYLGLAVFAFEHSLSVGMIVWSIILCLVGRAANIFPLTRLVNRFRRQQIQRDHAFIMWFSGLRGAIAFGLALNVPSANGSVLVTTTLAIVMFTIIAGGGGTMPLLKFLESDSPLLARLGLGSTIDMSKTADLGNPVDSHQEDNRSNSRDQNWVERLDNRFLKSIFRKNRTRRRMQDELAQHVRQLTSTYMELPTSEDEDDEGRGVDDRQRGMSSTSVMDELDDFDELLAERR